MRRNKNLRLIGFFCLVVVWLVVELNPLQSDHQFWRTIQAKDDLVSLPFTFPTLPDVIAINKTVADRQPHTESIAGNIGNNNFRGEKEVWPVKQTAAICSIIRDENRYLEEWTLYHLALGFDRIHIYDNSDTSAALRWLRDEQGNNTILQEGVLIHPFKNKANKRQLKAFRNCMKVYGKKHTWVAFLDPDEFLVLKKHDRVVDLLTHHCANGSLGINWVLFGTSNQTTYDDSPVTRRFQYHMGVDEHIKTIVKVSDYLGQQSAHWVKLADPTMRRDTNGKWIQGPKYSGVNNPTFHPNGPIDVATLHHYKYKSLSEYNAKGCSRGYVWNQKRCFNETLAELPAGYIWDDSAWQLLQKLVPYYRINNNNP